MIATILCIQLATTGASVQTANQTGAVQLFTGPFKNSVELKDSRLDSRGVFFMQMRVDDIEGLRCSTAATHPRIWLPFSDSIVAKVLSSGDVESAKKIAWRALGAQAGSAASCINERSDIISKFIEAGEMQVAHELIKTSEQVEITAPACESAGKTMIKTDRERLLRTSKWRNDIGAFQRAHLSIGAALMSKELMSK